jgi:hypothetical protein
MRNIGWQFSSVQVMDKATVWEKMKPLYHRKESNHPSILDIPI